MKQQNDSISVYIIYITLLHSELAMKSGQDSMDTQYYKKLFSPFNIADT